MNIFASGAALCLLIAAIALIWLTFRAFKQSFIWGTAVALLSPVSATAYGIKFWAEDKKPFLYFILPFVTGVTLCIYSFYLLGGFAVAQLSMDMHRSLQSQIYDEGEALEFAYVNYPVADESNPFRHNQRKLDLVAAFIDQYLPVMTTEDKQDLDYILQDLALAPRLAFRQKRHLEDMRSQLVPLKEELSAEKSGGLPDTVGGNKTSESKRYRLAYISIQPKDANNYVGSSVKIIRKNKLEKEYILTDTSPGRLHLVKKKQGGSFSFKLRHRDIDKLRVLVQQTY